MNGLLKQKVVWFIVLILQVSLVYGQATFKASAPGAVKEGEQFQLTFTANDDINNFQLPEVDGLTILGGPSQSTSTSIRVINGKTEQSKEVSYTYYARFDTPGTFTIPPASASVGGETVRSNEVTIEVIKQGASGSSSESADNQSSSEDPEVFIKLIPSKTSAYVGEPITMDLKLFTKRNITDIGRSYKEADFNGFYKEELEAPQLNQLKAENYNGEVYYTGVIKQFLVFPTRSGNLRISPFELEIQVQQQNQSRRRSPFDNFFGSSSAKWINYRTSPVTIRARALPDNKPSAFRGGVGRYSLKASLDGENITTDDAVTMKLTVSGSGNIKMIDEIPVDVPPTFDKLEPQISTNVKNSNNGYSGSKTFTYTFIPRSAGTFTIPAVEFAYFDPGSNRYKTHTTESYKIQVGKGQDTGNLTVISGVSKEDIQYIGQDIRFIKTSDPVFVHINSFILNKQWYPYAFVVFFALFLMVFFVFIKKEKESRNAVLTKNKKANKLARKKLKLAKKYLGQQDKEHFYAEMLRALWGYMSDKLMIQVADLSRDKAKETMLKHQVPEDLLEQFLGLTEKCEYARYAPAAGEEDMQDTYRKAVKTIVSIENKLK